MARSGYTDGQLVVNGLDLHYVEWGRRGSPVTVCLHGLYGQAHGWDFFAEALSDRSHIFALDQRGHGDSDRAGPDEYSIDQMASDLEGFVDALGLERFTLVGHSMGGMVGMAYSARNGNRVERLVLGDIGPEISDAWSSDWGDRPPEPLEFATFEEVVTHVQRTDHVNAWHAHEEALRRGLADVVRQREDGIWVWRADPALFRGAFGRSGIDLWQHYRAVTSPTLLVRGSESVLISDDILDRMKKANPNLSSVDVPGAGHMLHEDQPEAFLRVVQEWLDESSPS